MGRASKSSSPAKERLKEPLLPSAAGPAPSETPSASLERSVLPLKRPATEAQAKKPVGELVVICVGASHLPCGDNFIFSTATSDPFAVVYLQDRATMQQSPAKRTRPAMKTVNPRWREEFRFGLQTPPDDLVLHIDVFDKDDDKDDLLGFAELVIDRGVLRRLTRLRQEMELPLRHHPASGQHASSSGSVLIQVAWQPTLAASGTLEMLRLLATSPQLLRVVGISLLGLGGLLLLVAVDARWLCRGAEFAGCRGARVPGSPAASLIAGLAALSAFALHFLGSAGLFGGGWSELPPSLANLAAQREVLTHRGIEESGPGLNLQVASSGVWRWNVRLGLAGACLGQAPVTAGRLMTWLLQASAVVMTLIAVGLAWLETSRDTFLAEAAYLGEAAALNVVAGSACLAMAGASAKRQEKEDGWVNIEDLQDPEKMVSSGGSLGGSGSPVKIHSLGMGLESVANRAQKSIQTWKAEAESLAQPLLDAIPRQPLQGLQQHAEDTRQRLQRTARDASQPLLEARQRLQEYLEAMQSGAITPGVAAPEWVQHLLDTIHHHSAATAAGGGSPHFLPRLSGSPSAASRSPEGTGGQAAAVQRSRGEPVAPGSDAGEAEPLAPGPRQDPPPEPQEERNRVDTEVEEGPRAQPYLLGLCCRCGP